VSTKGTASKVGPAAVMLIAVPLALILVAFLFIAVAFIYDSATYHPVILGPRSSADFRQLVDAQWLRRHCR
jgi:hypothetical protein